MAGRFFLSPYMTVKDGASLQISNLVSLLSRRIDRAQNNIQCLYDLVHVRQKFRNTTYRY